MSLVEDSSANEPSACWQEAHATAAVERARARSSAAASVRADKSRTWANPDNCGRDEEEHPDTTAATTAHAAPARASAPRLGAPAGAGRVVSEIKTGTVESSHTPGRI